ncbi:MAG: hypothetical protein B6229_00435 [Spirochaetaceae bacterium 4572_7]|nr:MAG: hypothetical protein B6229_00435 [Spirochaetaceae bacterium 4572_7]
MRKVRMSEVKDHGMTIDDQTWKKVQHIVATYCRANGFPQYHQSVLQREFMNKVTDNTKIRFKNLSGRLQNAVYGLCRLNLTKITSDELKRLKSKQPIEVVFKELL